MRRGTGRPSGEPRTTPRGASLALAFTVGSFGGCRAPAPPPATTPPAIEPPAPPSATAPEPEPEPEPEPPKVEGYEPVAELLSQRVVSWYWADVRMAMARRGPVRLRPDGPPLGLADDAPFPRPERLMVVDDAASPRVLLGGDVRLLLYVDRIAAQPVVTTYAPLRPDPSFVVQDPPRRGHAVLLPGALVDVVTEGEDAVEVEYHLDDTHLRGWVDADAIGTSAGTRARARSDEDLVTRRRTALRVRPGGKTLMKIPDEERVHGLLPARKGYQLVEYEPVCQDEWLSIGFVKTRDLAPAGLGLVGCGHGGSPNPRLWGEAEGAPRRLVDAGRILLDPDTPLVVGCVHATADLADLGDDLVAVPTIWGPITARLAPEDFEGRCTSE